MKHINLCLLIFIMHFNCFAQDNTSSQKAEIKVKTEIGINITNLLSTIIDLSENTPVEEPFDFALKRVKDNQAFRLHFGISGSKERDNNNFDQTISFTRTNLKLGKEWRKNLNKRFDFFYGFDFLFDYQMNKVESERSNGDEIDFTEQNIQFGPIVFIGGIFHINKNLYISTKAGFDFLYQYTHQKTKDETRIVSDEVEKMSGFMYNTHVPKSLYLYFKF